MRNQRKGSKESSKKGCQVCEEAESRYKCPVCLIPYCSLICFKKHKEIPCTRPLAASENDTSTIILATDVARPCYVDFAHEVLPPSQLECVASSTEIRDALKNKKLQELIRNIDSSTDAETELEKAMEDESFHLFTEKVLAMVNPSGNKQV